MAVMMEIIEWMDMVGTDMIHRIPESGSLDIKAGAQLIVRESQSAVFFKSGSERASRLSTIPFGPTVFNRIICPARCLSMV